MTTSKSPQSSASLKGPVLFLMLGLAIGAYAILSDAQLFSAGVLSRLFGLFLLPAAIFLSLVITLPALLILIKRGVRR